MRGRVRQPGLLALGIFVGVMISLNFPAVAQPGALGPLPLEELRAFAEVFGRIKSDYIESVDDKRFITQAVPGMLTGLDPHSGYLARKSFVKCRSARAASSVASV